MDVSFAIGTAMVLAMVRRPPQWTFLQREAPQGRANELEPARRLESTVRKVAMIKGRQAKCANQIHGHRKRHGNKAPAGPKYHQAPHMH
jgi:hypothetical protein